MPSLWLNLLICKLRMIIIIALKCVIILLELHLVQTKNHHYTHSKLCEFKIILVPMEENHVEGTNSLHSVKMEFNRTMERGSNVFGSQKTQTSPFPSISSLQNRSACHASRAHIWRLLMWPHYYLSNYSLHGCSSQDQPGEDNSRASLPVAKAWGLDGHWVFDLQGFATCHHGHHPLYKSLYWLWPHMLRDRWQSQLVDLRVDRPVNAQTGLERGMEKQNTDKLPWGP